MLAYGPQCWRTRADSQRHAPPLTRSGRSAGPDVAALWPDVDAPVDARLDLVRESGREHEPQRGLEDGAEPGDEMLGLRVA